MTAFGTPPATPSYTPPRAVGRQVVQDRVTGALLPNALVTVVESDGVTPVTFDFWTGLTGRSDVSPSQNPFAVTNGTIEIYTEAGEIMTLLVDVGGHARATVTDFETEVPFGPIVTNAPVTGYVLMATDATHVAWAEPTGGSSVINPDDPSTVPSVIYEKDTNNVVWEIRVDTTGHLTTNVHLGPPTPVYDVTIQTGTQPFDISWAVHVADYSATDTYTVSYANQAYLASAPADGDYNDLGTYHASDLTVFMGSGDPILTLDSPFGILLSLQADSGDQANVVHARVTKTRGSATTVFAEGVSSPGFEVGPVFNPGGGFQAN